MALCYIVSYIGSFKGLPGYSWGRLTGWSTRLGPAGGQASFVLCLPITDGSTLLFGQVDLVWLLKIAPMVLLVLLYGLMQLVTGSRTVLSVRGSSSSVFSEVDSFGFLVGDTFSLSISLFDLWCSGNSSVGFLYVLYLFSEALLVYTFGYSVRGNFSVCASTPFFGPLVLIPMSIFTSDGVEKE